MSNFVPTNYKFRTSLVFCYYLKKTAAESHGMFVEAFDEHALAIFVVIIFEMYSLVLKFKY